MMTCEEVRLALGAHALGALDPDEALEVDQHLATCEECGAELLDLEGVASFLGKVSERDVELVVSPPRQVLDRLLNDRVKRTRRGRLLLVAAASVVTLALGGTVWTAVSNDTPEQSAMAPVSVTPASTQPPASVLDATEDSKAKSLSSQAEPSASRKPTTRPTALPTRASKQPSRAPREAVDGPTFKGRTAGFTASVSAWPGDDGGTELGVQVGGVPVGTTCSLIVVAADGRSERTQSWAVSQEAYEEHTVFKRVTSLPMDDIARFDVVDQAGKVLVRVPVRK
ncbi:anti-sigma factor family protein [Nonomuraea helvata]|uniref:Zf-HC2 domain-containing protein n=1 Tax=Nonomuraea helvata TaxID=37484 RepID=A0ABV5S8Q7_9ACTN